MIVPLVVYQGTRRWSYPVELSELLDVDPETVRAADDCVPRFRFVLDDLTQLDEAALRARPVTTPVRLTVRLLRIVPAHGGDATAALTDRDIDDLRDLQRFPDWQRLLGALLTYIEIASETPPHKLASLAARIGPEAEEVYVSTADMLRAEGRAEGAGRLLVRQLTRRFGAVPAEVRAAIDAATLEQLDTWSDRVLDPPTLDDVFR